jgi:hypothetical protein
MKPKKKFEKGKQPFMRLAGIMKGLPRDLSSRKGFSHPVGENSKKS